MNTEIKLSPHPFPPSQPEVEGETTFSPILQRGGKICVSLVSGALAGGGGYLMFSLLKRFNFLAKESVVQPLPYILLGVINAAVVETAQLTCDIALYVLGDRDKYENLVESDKASTFDYLRQRCWKVVTSATNLQKSVDQIYSKRFGIRTEDEIRAKFATDKDYYLAYPRLMELVRRAFLEQSKVMVTQIAPQQLALNSVQSMGYSLCIRPFSVQLIGLLFVAGVIFKVNEMFVKIEAAQNE